MDAKSLTNEVKKCIIFLSEPVSSGEGGQLEMKLKMANAPRGAKITIYDDKNADWWIEMSLENLVVRRKLEKEMAVNVVKKIVSEVFPGSENDVWFRE